MATNSTAPGVAPAGLRHVYTAAGAAITVLGAITLLTPEQVVQAKAAIDEIAHGFGVLIAIGGAVMPVLMSWRAMVSAGPLAQVKSLLSSAKGQEVLSQSPGVLQAVASNPQVVEIKADPDLAMSVPSPKVTPQ